LILTLNFTSIQQHRINRRLQSLEKRKFRLAWHAATGSRC